MLVHIEFTTGHASRDPRKADERPWRAPRSGRPSAPPWRELLPVCPPLVRRDRAVLVVRDTRYRDERRDNCDRRPRHVPRHICDAQFSLPLPRMPTGALFSRAPLPACQSLDRRGPAGPAVRDSIQLASHMRLKPSASPT